MTIDSTQKRHCSSCVYKIEQAILDLQDYTLQ